MTNILRNAKNGCNGNIRFFNQPVYYETTYCPTNTMEELGKKTNKKEWVNQHLTDMTKRTDVEKLLVDWELYENGWFVSGWSNKHLFYYRCQIGNYGDFKPKALDFLEK